MKHAACALALVAAALLGGCGLFGGGSSSSAEPPRTTGLEAALRPVANSAVMGSVRFAARSGGVTMMVNLHGLPGTQYRAVIHANGNCSSPNGFSAGAPWTPPGATGPLAAELRPFTTNTEGTGSLTVRLSDVAVDGPNGLAGKSVVVHQGTRGALDAQPDAPNDRVACGVLGPVQTLF